MTNCLLPSQAALILRLSATSVRRLVDSGRLAAVRGPMGIRLVDRDAVELMALERARRAAPDDGRAPHTGT